jgi:large subunit ribosomal protein L22
MEAKAKIKYIRVSPYKLRPIAKLICGKDANRALMTLKFMPQKGARIIEESLKSVIANATVNHHMRKENLLIKTVCIDEGSVLKRWQPRARGRAFPIKKRSSHVSIVLMEKESTRS